MLNRIALIGAFVLLSWTAYSQAAVPQQIRAQNTLDRLGTIPKSLSGRGDILYGIPIPPGDVRGSVYLNEKWNLATLMLNGSEKLIEGYPVKYNLKDEEIEIFLKTGNKVIEARKIKSFVWKDSTTNTVSYFVNGNSFKEDGTPLTGLLQVVVDGKFPLLKRSYVLIKQPDYTPGIDVGSKDIKIFKKENHYYAIGSEVVKIGNKKSLITSFGEQGADMEAYLKTNKLSLNNEPDLVMLFEYYNSKFN